jgi:hypothetical protein
MLLGCVVLSCACTELASPDERGLALGTSVEAPASELDGEPGDVANDDLSGNGDTKPSVLADDGGASADTSSPEADASAERDGGSSKSVDGGPDEPVTPAACPNELSFGQSCYRPARVALIWDDARSDCVAGGAELVQIDSLAEDAFVATLLDQSMWLGASDRALEGLFVWVDGSAVSAGNWGPGQPDSFPGQNCVQKREEPGEPWYDQSCDNLELYVCERPSAD